MNPLVPYLLLQSALILIVAAMLYLSNKKLKALQTPTPLPRPQTLDLSIYPLTLPTPTATAKARRKHHPRNYYTKDMITTAKLLIHNRGMTLKEAAAILGVSSSTICRYAHLTVVEAGETPDNTTPREGVPGV